MNLTVYYPLKNMSRIWFDVSREIGDEPATILWPSGMPAAICIAFFMKHPLTNWARHTANNKVKIKFSKDPSLELEIVYDNVNDNDTGGECRGRVVIDGEVT